MPQSMTKSILATIALAVAAVICLWVLFATRYIVLAGLIGIGLGVILTPVMNLLRRRFRVPRGVSAALLVLILVFGLLGIGYGLGSLVVGQIELLSQRAPEIIESIRKQASSILSRQPWIGEQVQRLQLGNLFRTAAGTVFAGAVTGVSALAGAFVVVAIALYTAVNSRDYFRGFLSLFPAYLRPKVSDVMMRSASSLRRWLGGQALVMLISGSVTALGLLILGIDYWLLLGILTAVLGFIPFIGAFISGFFTVLVTLGSDPSKVWWVLGLYLLIQQLEGDVTIPLVMRGRARLPEVHLVILMLIMGSLFGIIGVFVAPPLLAVLHEVYMMTYVPLMNSKRVPVSM